MKTQSKKKNATRIVCHADEIWRILGKTWALLILKKIATSKTVRFSEIKKSIPQISNTVLSERLRDLVEYDLVRKKIYAQIPPHVEYRITTQTKELGKILKRLDNWVIQWKKEKPKKK